MFYSSADIIILDGELTEKPLHVVLVDVREQYGLAVFGILGVVVSCNIQSDAPVYFGKILVFD
jgi:hypothetical protein